MRPHLRAALGLLAAFGWSDLSAQKPACTLLTPADIGTITGAKPIEPHPTDLVIPEGPQKGQTVNGCMWGTEGRGLSPDGRLGPA